MTDASTAASSLPMGMEERIYSAIAVQRPAVIAHIKEIRRTNPDASPAEIINALESRYLAAVTAASAGVGGAAVVPGIGTAIALSLSAVDLLLFFELSGLFALSVAEVHGITVNDPDLAKVLVLGMTLGDDSQARITQLVIGATSKSPATSGSVAIAAKAATAARDGAWGDMVATAVPNGQLNPLAKRMLTASAAKLGAKVGSGTVAKVIPFGIGAVVGGAASFLFGKSVVKAARAAFSAPPAELPDYLTPTDADGDGIPDPPRALVAMRNAAGEAKNLTEDVWNRASDKVVSAANLFRSVDLDGDGVPDEARALTAVKGLGRSVAGAAGAVAGGAGAVAGAARASVFRRRKTDAGTPADQQQPPGEPE